MRSVAEFVDRPGHDQRRWSSFRRPRPLGALAASLAALAALAAVVLLPGNAACQEREEAALAVTTCFPGGSAEILAVDPATRTIRIQPANHPGHGWPCWWYLRLDSLKPGEEIQLEVRSHPAPFRGDSPEVLDASWSLPHQAVVSTDHRAWLHTDRAERPAENRAIYRFRAEAPTMWVAWGPPFLPSDSEALIERLVREAPAARRFVLARTREGREVPGIRLDALKAETSTPPGVIWVQARQHAWETSSSWVARGFLEWATGQDPLAQRLRDTTTIYVVPIMDVDNVTRGAGGKESEPHDHNRDWSDRPLYPEVAAAQAMIRGWDSAGRFRMFFDLHGPGPGNGKPYFPWISPLSLPPYAPRYLRFDALAREEIQDPLPMEPSLVVHDSPPTREIAHRISGNWAREHTGADTLALTFEIAWNSPASTPEGYRAVGAQLGRTMARSLYEERPVAAAGGSAH